MSTFITRKMSPQEILFRKFLTINKDILLGGSVILKKYGLINREPKDLDIICHSGMKEFISFIRQLQLISPSKTKEYYYNTDKLTNHYRININGIDVCVFVYTKDQFSNMKHYSPNECKIINIIEAKQQYINNWWEKNKGKKNPTPPPSILKHMNDINFYLMKKVNMIYKNFTIINKTEIEIYE